ncbi:hypothetical protein BR93DRAFT_856230, partial [Coniochaeta sp. PMI_546]
QEAIWPTGLREHATYLSKYLRDALLCVKRAKDQPVPAELAKAMVLGTMSLIVKMQNIPDLNTVHDVLRLVQTETKIAAE